MKLKIETVVPIWTGGIIGECDRLHETGIMGSIRWWYETVVRGLGGYACDPVDTNTKCYFELKDFKNLIDKGEASEASLNQLICSACQLFGCTGWSKKIKFVIDDQQMNPTIIINDRKKIKIGLEGKFVLLLQDLKAFTKEEKWLLYKTFYLIDKYGTIGGKCMLKPSQNPKRGIYCEDRGLVNVIWKESELELPEIDKQEIINYLKGQRIKLEEFQEKKEPLSEWPDLRYFIFAPHDGLDAEDYMKLQDKDLFPDFLKGEKGAGEKKARANKFASFKKKERFWGYTKAEPNDEMFNKVISLLKGLNLKGIITGREVIENEF